MINFRKVLRILPCIKYKVRLIQYMYECKNSIEYEVKKYEKVSKDVFIAVASL